MHGCVNAGLPSRAAILHARGRCNAIASLPAPPLPVTPRPLPPGGVMGHVVEGGMGGRGDVMSEGCKFPS